MNDIKFRGKSLSNDQWVYGYYVFSSNAHLIHEGEFGFGIWSVDPKSIGQYIGLKAKNVEIYVGSIIDQFDHRFVGESCPGGYQLGVYYKKGLCCGRQSTYTISALDLEHCWVVGNIHDNPELLEG